MSIRDNPADAGERDARRLLEALRRELRSARVAANLSQGTVARSAGLSTSAYARLERGDLESTPVEQLARVARALGRELSIQAFATGSPVRDAAHLRLERDYVALLGGGLLFRSEVPLPIESDRRAWDGVTSNARALAFNEFETRLGDMQELARRLGLKLRDDPRSRLLILVVRSTRHNRRVLAEHREGLRLLLPLDGAAVLRSLRAGRLPVASGLVVL